VASEDGARRDDGLVLGVTARAAFGRSHFVLVNPMTGEALGSVTDVGRCAVTGRVDCVALGALAREERWLAVRLMTTVALHLGMAGDDRDRDRPLRTAMTTHTFELADRFIRRKLVATRARRHRCQRHVRMDHRRLVAMASRADRRRRRGDQFSAELVAVATGEPGDLEMHAVTRTESHLPIS
jgi:hypothetical protein